MKTKTLLFILGAGASAPYGFPSGAALVRRILDENLMETFGDISFDLDIYDSEFGAFQEDLSLSDLQSVDAFLENNPKYIKLGKLIIAYFIAQFESTEFLYAPGREDNWYQYLVDKMLRNYPFPEIEKNNIGFITYNYDRSLEFYLFNALKRSNQTISEEDCIQRMSKFPIVHLHGSLGAPQYSGKGSGKPYVVDSSPNQLRRSANDIHIISEEISKYAEFTQAHQMIAKADRVIFLGFGYHPINVRRLQFDEHLKAEADLWGTAYGYTESERQCLILEQFKPFRKIALEPTTCTDFLRNHVELIVG